MNIGTFLHNGQTLYGVFENGMVARCSPSLLTVFSTLRDLLDGDGVTRLQSDVASHDRWLDCDDITFLQPVPNPRKIICVGMNYPKPLPVEGSPPPSPDNMILFGKEREALLPHGAALQIPKGDAANSFDFEGEIAVVIGKPARHVSTDEAKRHILGYAPFNDGSVREWQKHSVYAGKNFANSSAWGPWITTADALPPPEDLFLSVTLNGETVQTAYGREMIFSVAQQISYASSLFTLSPGDVIATGSPDRVGDAQTTRRFLKKQDVLAVSVSGVCTLQNSVL